MHNIKRKIINDPVHGFITINHPLILQIIAHPYYQRLRRINQMAFAHLVYPGAIHTRLHHSLGAYHLMCNAISELKSKGIDITADEELGAKVAILLHDAGHGPFSHALEKILIPGIHHEDISLQMMYALNEQFKGKLDTAIAIFTNKYQKPFLHQLVSGQLDVDRLDYLTRDSFFTGVSEGVIGYDRIIKMLTVHNGELVVEEKGIYSIEKFLVSRRLMYWQVYLHKTVISAEMMLVKIIKRAKQLINNGFILSSATPEFDFFLGNEPKDMTNRQQFEFFCRLDDFDVMTTIKNWMHHSDKVLSTLSRLLIDRSLLKVKLSTEPFQKEFIEENRNIICNTLGLTVEESDYFIFTDVAENTTYNPTEEKINILFRDGNVKDISQVDNALIHQTLSVPVKKFYICFFNS